MPFDQSGSGGDGPRDREANGRLWMREFDEATDAAFLASRQRTAGSDRVEETDAEVIPSESDIDEVSAGDEPRESRGYGTGPLSWDEFDAVRDAVILASRQRTDPEAVSEPDGPTTDAASEPAPDVVDSSPDGNARPEVDAALADEVVRETDQEPLDPVEVGDGQSVIDSAPAGGAAREKAEPAEESAPVPYRELMHIPDQTGRRPSDALLTFDPEKAGLPPLTREQAEDYLRTVDFEKRPWLKGIDELSPEARYVIAAIDQGDGHALQRHEGHGSGQNAIDRLTKLHDMANTNEASRKNADDAYKTDANGQPKRHVCGAEATCIKDLETFAEVIANVMDHPAVQAELAKDYDPTIFPEPIRIPIGGLLGRNGHEYCEGYRLKPVNGSIEQARQQRTEGVKAQRAGETTTLPALVAERIDSFEGGAILCMLAPKRDGSGYTIRTLYPEAPRSKES